MLHIRVFLIGSPMIDFEQFQTYLFTYIFFKRSGKIYVYKIVDCV